MFYVLSWGFASLVITFFGSLVLARLLNPRDFGLIAIGQTVVTLASTTAEGRIANGFIRQPRGISRPVSLLHKRLPVRNYAGHRNGGDVGRKKLRTGGDCYRDRRMVTPDCQPADGWSCRAHTRVALQVDCRDGSIRFVGILRVGNHRGLDGAWGLESRIRALVRAAVITLVVGAIVGWDSTCPFVHAIPRCSRRYWIRYSILAHQSDERSLRSGKKHHHRSDRWPPRTRTVDTGRSCSSASVLGIPTDSSGRVSGVLAVYRLGARASSDTRTCCQDVVCSVRHRAPSVSRISSGVDYDVVRSTMGRCICDFAWCYCFVFIGVPVGSSVSSSSSSQCFAVSNTRYF